MKISFLPLILLASCTSLKKEEEPIEEKPKVAGPEKRIIGRIASISHAGEFVLIQKFGPGALPKNTIYQSQGPGGRSASLRPSGERVRDFYAADLVSGSSQKGDAVVGYPDYQKETENVKKDPQAASSESNSPPSDEKKAAAKKNATDHQTIRATSQN